MQENIDLVNSFYEAFSNKDGHKMADMYADDATFEDSVFGYLTSMQTKAMWKMLTSRSQDLKISWSPPVEKNGLVETTWTARYSFGPSKRKVVNIIEAKITIANGKITQHKDRFSFYRWSRQALGPVGWLLGWTPYLQAKVQKSALKGLKDYMSKESV